MSLTTSRQHPADDEGRYADMPLTSYVSARIFDMRGAHIRPERVNLVTTA
jgi:hypothetical protein